MGNIRKRTQFILLAAACALLVCGAAFLLAGCGGEEETPPPAPPDKESMSVVSPDGSLEVSFGMDGDGQLFYTVEKDGTSVVERSSLGFTIEEDDFGLLEMEDTQERTVSGSYQNITRPSPHLRHGTFTSTSPCGRMTTGMPSVTASVARTEGRAPSP